MEIRMDSVNYGVALGIRYYKLIGIVLYILATPLWGYENLAEQLVLPIDLSGWQRQKLTNVQKGMQYRRVHGIVPLGHAWALYKHNGSRYFNIWWGIYKLRSCGEAASYLVGLKERFYVTWHKLSLGEQGYYAKSCSGRKHLYVILTRHGQYVLKGQHYCYNCEIATGHLLLLTKVQLRKLARKGRVCASGVNEDKDSSHNKVRPLDSPNTRRSEQNYVRKVPSSQTRRPDQHRGGYGQSSTPDSVMAKFTNKKQHPAVIRAWHRVLADPNKAVFFAELGQQLHEHGQHAAAAHALNMAARLSTNLAQKHRYLAACYDMLRHTTAAHERLAALQSLVEDFSPSAPQYEKYYYNLYQHYRYQRNYAKALSIVTKMQKLYPNGTYRRKVDYANMEIMTKKLAEHYGDRGWRHAWAAKLVTQAITEFNTGNYEEAISLCRQARQGQCSRSSESWFWQGRCLLKQKHYADAQQAFIKALQGASRSLKKNYQEWLAQAQQLQVQSKRPVIRLQLATTNLSMTVGSAKVITFLRVSNKGGGTAHNVVIDLDRAYSPIAKFGLSGNLPVGDLSPGAKRELRHKLYRVYAKQVGRTQLFFRATCDNGEDSPNCVLQVIVTKRAVQTNQVVAARVKYQGKGVRRAQVSDGVMSCNDRKTARELKWHQQKHGVHFQVRVIQGLHSAGQLLLAQVNQAIILEVTVHTAKRAVWVAFAPMQINGVGPTTPKLDIDQGVWEFTRRFGQAKTILAKGVILPLQQFTSKIHGIRSDWDVTVPANEEVRIVTTITPRAGCRFHIHWQYAYTFDPGTFYRREYQRYEIFQGDLDINVVQKEYDL